MYYTCIKTSRYVFIPFNFVETLDLNRLITIVHANSYKITLLYEN